MERKAFCTCLLEMQVTEFEALVLELPLSEIKADEQQVFVGDLGGCVPRLADGAEFQAERVWVEDDRLKVQGQMMHYQRSYVGGGDVTGGNKRG